jgi:spore germination protein YaaH
MRLPHIIFIFALSFICSSAAGQTTVSTSKNIKAEVDKLKKEDSLKTENFLKSLVKAFSFVSKLREKEKKRVSEIIKKHVQEAGFLSSADIKKINDSLAKNHHVQFDSLVKLINALNKDKEKLAKNMGSLRKGMDSLASIIPGPAEEIEMNKLVTNLLPMLKEKANEEELKEQREKKLKIVRRLINHPEGVIDTMAVNDSISKKFTLRLQKKEVIGFHPYWRNNQYYLNYNFSVLSSLIYYGYELDMNTGLCKSTHEWNKQNVTDYAKKENCKVYLGVFCESEKGISALLKSNEAQNAFINSIITQLPLKHANGVNLSLGSPEGSNRLRLLRFIKLLSDKLTAADPQYRITLTIPVLDKTLMYDIKALEPMVEYFIIDFSKKNLRGPIAPITGNDYSLESGINRYLGSNVAPEKFIACLPYHGAVWDSESHGEFLNYIIYSEIAEAYTNEFGYHYDHGTERIDVVFNKTDTIEQLWFDDARTLSEKYDYALNKDLSGVAIWALGNDNFKPELWEVLLDKMVLIDTTDVQEIKKTPSPAPHHKTFWEKVERELYLYKMLFMHPCDFENTGGRDEMVLDDYVFHIVLVVFLLLVFTGIYAITKNRSLGDDWPNRKLFLFLLIILTVVNMIAILMYSFLSKDYKGFGAYSSSDNRCEVNLIVLLKLLCIGFILGGFSMRLLVMPLIKRKEIP